MAKCDCKVLGSDHEEWCSSHPLKLKIQELEEQVESLKGESMSETDKKLKEAEVEMFEKFPKMVQQFNMQTMLLPIAAAHLINILKNEPEKMYKVKFLMESAIKSANDLEEDYKKFLKCFEQKIET